MQALSDIMIDHIFHASMLSSWSSRRCLPRPYGVEPAWEAPLLEPIWSPITPFPDAAAPLWIPACFYRLLLVPTLKKVRSNFLALSSQSMDSIYKLYVQEYDSTHAKNQPQLNIP